MPRQSSQVEPSAAPHAPPAHFGCVRAEVATGNTQQASTVRQRGEWPSERLNRLKALFDDGLSHVLIAKAMGTTKSAISGKLHRLGWSREETTISARRPACPKKVAAYNTSIAKGRRASISGQALQAQSGNLPPLRDVLACVDRRLGRR